jgi:hypothetical protein
MGYRREKCKVKSTEYVVKDETYKRGYLTDFDSIRLRVTWEVMYTCVGIVRGILQRSWYANLYMSVY